MILVDTSVWVGHFRAADAHLQTLLEEDQVLCHPFIVGELALGHMKKREEILTDLSALPSSPMAETGEILAFIDKRGLYGRGIGYVDAHLLASASLAKAALWTFDGRLRSAAERLGLSPKIRKDIP